MTRAMKLAEIMISDVKTIDINSSVHEAARLMNERRIGSLVVTEDGVHVGILTERDILRKVVAENTLPTEISVDEVMTFPLTTLKDYITVREAVKKMSSLGFRRMPITRNGKLVGIVCDRDIFREAPYLMGITRSGVEEGDEGAEERSSGRCEDCGAHSYEIGLYDGVYRCPNCR